MRRMKKNKRLNKLTAVFVAVSLLLLSDFTISFAETTSVLRVEGEIASGNPDVEVAIEVFHTGKSFDDIKIGEDMTDVILYHGQTATTRGGAYNFEFEVPGNAGVCTAYIYSGEGDISVIDLTYDNSVDIDASVLSEQTGHIYFTPGSQKFKLRVDNKKNSKAVLKVKKTLVYEGRAQTATEEEITLNGIDEQEFEITTAAEKYGFYTLKTEIYCGDTCVEELEPIRFSVANIPDETVNNEKLGTNMSLRGWQTTEDEFFNGLELVDKVGFGFIRASVDLQNYNSNRIDGETGFVSEWHRKAFEELAKRKMGITFMFSRNNYDGPQTEGFNEKFSAYAASIVNDPLIKPVTNEFTTINEPDLKDEKMGKPYNVAEHYIPFAKTLYEGVKNVNEDAFVWGPVVAGVENRTWLTEFLAQGGGKYIDGLDIHGYTLKKSPEEGGLVRYLQRIRELMTSYSILDKPVYRSEYGWTSVGENGYTDEQEQAYYNIRMLFLHDAYNLCDKAASYELVDGGAKNEQENRFGMLRWREADIPLEAKPLYLAYGNYNSLMTGATFNERIALTSDVAVYKYTLADGRDCAVTWSIGGKADVALNIDKGEGSLSEIQFVDNYGNEETIHSKNGDFMLSLTKEPIYLIGDFDSIKSGTNKITTDKNEELMVPGGSTAVTLTKSFGDNAEIVLDLSDNLTVVENNGFSGNNARIVLRASEQTEKYETAVIYVKQNGDVVYKAELLANFSNDGVTVKRNGSVVVDLSTVAENDTLTFNIAARDIDENVDIFLAGYQGDELAVAKKKNVTAADFTRNGAAFEIVVPGDFDKFKVFIWDMNHSPILEAFTIGG